MISYNFGERNLNQTDWNWANRRPHPEQKIEAWVETEYICKEVKLVKTENNVNIIVLQILTYIGSIVGQVKRSELDSANEISRGQSWDN